MIRFVKLNWHKILLALVAVAAIAAAVLIPLWSRTVEKNLRRQASEPFRIAGNLYFVGGSETSSFLITDPAGDVLIDSGRTGLADMIVTSISTLGFDIRNVKILLNSSPYGDHAGGLSELQQASGAQLWASEDSSRILAAGGDNPENLLPLRLLTLLLKYPAPHVDHQFKDGETIQVGATKITAHITGGHTRGCASYSFQVRDGERLLNVVSACPLGIVAGMRYPEQEADLKRSFSVLRGLPVDIWVTSRSTEWQRYWKFLASAKAKNPVDPFIDREGYRDYIDAAEDAMRRGIVH